MGKWFLYTVICGALPIICRLTLYFLLDEPKVKLFYSGDFLIYGLILHISMLHCLEVAEIKNQHIPTIINGYSLLGIFLYSILLPLTIIPIETLLEERVLFLAAICCFFSMLISCILQGFALSNSGSPKKKMAADADLPSAQLPEQNTEESKATTLELKEILDKSQPDTVKLLGLLHSLVLENPIPAKIIAREVGKPYSTLLREINPYDHGAKLGVDTFIELMRFTNNIAPLKFMAEQLGYTITPDRSPDMKRGVAETDKEDSRNS